MILGMGTDITSVERMRRLIAKEYGKAFLDRVFTQSEQAYCERMADPSPFYAARWALKEAFYKALPEKIQKLSSWKSVELLRNTHQKPQLVIVDDILIGAFNSYGTWYIHQSISHEKEYCVATVILEVSDQR